MESSADEHEHPFLEWLSLLPWIALFFLLGHDDGSLGHFLCLYGFFMTQIPSFFYSIWLWRAFSTSLKHTRKYICVGRWNLLTFRVFSVFRRSPIPPHSALNNFNIHNPRMRSGIENDSPHYHNLTISGEIKLFYQRYFHVMEDDDSSLLFLGRKLVNST